MGPNTVTNIRRTLRYLYDEEAMGYAARTAHYTEYPGLKDEVDAFANKIKRNSIVLDLGSGPGRDSRYLLTQGFSVISLDFSRKMLEVGRGSKAVLIQADIAELPFRANIFSGIWACASILHLPLASHAQALSEMLRVLAPGGLAAVSMKAGSGEGWSEGRSIQRQRWFALVKPTDFVAQMNTVGFSETSWSWCNRGTWFIAEGAKKRAS